MLQKAEMVKYRQIVESFFNNKCDVYEYEDYKDGVFSAKRLKLVQSNIPCRRGYSTGGNINYAKTGEVGLDNVAVKQLVKLFMPYDTDIKEGSLVKVCYGGCEEYYEYSGSSLVYDTHIEVLLRSVKECA